MKLITASILTLSCVASGAHARETQVLSFAAPTRASPAEEVAGDASPSAIEPETAAPAPTSMPARVDAPGASPIVGITTFPTDRLLVPAWMRRGESSHAFVPIPIMPAISTTCGPVAYRPLPGLSSEVEARRSAYFYTMAAAACGAGVPLELYDALILQESQYRPLVVSPKGAAGLSQLMPQTARDLNVSNVWDAAENLRAGARYLRAQIDEFARYDLALGAYNAGPGRIREYRGLPPFRETQAYVSRILHWTQLHLAMRSGTAAGYVRAIAIALVPQRISAVSSF